MRVVIFFLLMFFNFFAFVQAQCLDSLKIATWNTKHLGRKNFDYTNATNLLQAYDLIALQEVNTNATGENALQSLREMLAKSSGEKWCSAISPTPTGSKERYAYLWRNSKVAFVKDRIVHADCDGNHYHAELASEYEKMIVREPAVATFFSKKENNYFRYASIHLVPTAKSPENEVPYLFKSFAKETLLTIIGGDFNLSSAHPIFNAVKSNDWKNILPDDTKTSLRAKSRSLNMAYDNLWIKNTGKLASHCEKDYEVNNSYASLPALSVQHIYNKISDHVPVEMNYFSSENKRSIASEQKMQDR